MLSLAATFDKIKLENVTDASPRSVAALAKELKLERPFSLRDVMSAAWEEVTFPSDGLTLVGYLYKPLGPGPFPALIWNHGSGKFAEILDFVHSSFSAVAAIFVPAGYVVFCPVRRGALEGENIDDVFDDIADKDEAKKRWVLLMESQQLDDQLAGLKYLKKQPYVDKNRLVVAGCSYGGIQTLLGAERAAESEVEYKAAVAISPASQTWGNEYLRARLIWAVTLIGIPVFLIHPQHDDSVEPGYTLGHEFHVLKKPYGLAIYPPIGSDDLQKHCFGAGNKGIHIWAPSVLQFLDEVLKS